MSRTKNKNNNNVKSNKKKIEDVEENFDGKIGSALFVVIGVLCFILAFYLFTLYLTSRDNTNSLNTSTQEATISYTKILGGNSFSVSEGEYLVVYYNVNDDTSINDIIHTYRNAKKLSLYEVDMNDPLNTKYKSDHSNTSPTSASELKISAPTLVKFNNRVVEEYIEGTDSIIDYLSK